MPLSSSSTTRSNNSSSSSSSASIHNSQTEGELLLDDDSNRKYSKSSASSCLQSVVVVTMGLFTNKHWKGSNEFLRAQGQVIAVLAIAYIGNNWPHSYHRNENHNPTMFWIMNLALLVAGIFSIKHEPSRVNRTTGQTMIQLLSRPQTEEWKGWMQWAFIMYHYYRMYAVYNEIRVFVSAYVWMTGFGNFLYFDKKQDFTLERAVSMWIRINYFPLLLSFFLNVPLELYYVVPLHTVGFFITMATCYFAKQLENFSPTKHMSRDRRNIIAIFTCLAVHVAFYETPAVNFLKIFSDEYHFRFQADKYSAWIGILSGFLWHYFKTFMQWCHGPKLGIATTSKNGNGEAADNDDNSNDNLVELPHSSAQIQAAWAQRIGGVGLMALWYCLFGYMADKFSYNPMHPYIFWMPVFGWLALRNSSRYLTEVHSTVMEFFGKITLETYVLQFHVFMCNKVQHIPVVIPGANADGPEVLKALNMLVCGCLFVGLAYWARQITVTTQTTLTELLTLLLRGPPPTSSSDKDDNDKDQEKVFFKTSMSTVAGDGADDDKTTITATTSLSSSGSISMGSLNEKKADV